MRRAVMGDVPLLETWDADPAVAAAGGEDDDADWREEIAASWQEVWIAEEDGRPVGVLVLLDVHADPARYWGDAAPGVSAIDIWIGHDDDRCRGLGRRMMVWALERAHDQWQSPIVLIDPLAENQRAIAFYRSCGFTDVGPRVFGRDRCWVLEHRDQRSPMTGAGGG